jgi:predicted RNA-binding Zn-ribbon protein involved in translation (DUF1610 family)
VVPGCGKVAIPTEADARAFLDAKTNYWDLIGRDRLPMVVYRCPRCGAWHVGRRDPMVTRRRLARPRAQADFRTARDNPVRHPDPEVHP